MWNGERERKRQPACAWLSPGGGEWGDEQIRSCNYRSEIITNSLLFFRATANVHISNLVSSPNWLVSTLRNFEALHGEFQLTFGCCAGVGALALFNGWPDLFYTGQCQLLTIQAGLHQCGLIFKLDWVTVYSSHFLIYAHRGVLTSQ